MWFRCGVAGVLTIGLVLLIPQVMRKLGLEAAFGESANEIFDDAIGTEDGLLGVVGLEDLVEEFGWAWCEQYGV